MIQLVVGLVGAWAGSLLIESTRSYRFLPALIAWSLVWLFTALLPGWTALLAQVALFGAWAFTAADPARLDLAPITRQEKKVDLELRLVDGLMNSGTGAAKAKAVLDGLIVDMAGREDYWKVTTRLLRWAAGRRLSSRPPPDWALPPEAYVRSAESFWKVALWKRMLVGRLSPSVADEEIALRCFHEELQSMMNTELNLDAVALSPADRIGEAQQLLDALGSFPLIHPVSAAVRDGLIAATQAELEIKSGPSSGEAEVRQRETAYRMRDLWAELAAEASAAKGNKLGHL